MSYVIPIESWVNLLGAGRQGGVKKRESPDFRSPEVGISETIPWSVTGYEPVTSRKPCSYTSYKFHDEFLNS